MQRLEWIVQKALLIIGIIGTIVMYGGCSYLLWKGAPINFEVFFLLPCPLVCIYFGLGKPFRPKPTKSSQSSMKA
ncbi:hypothetical protein [Parashewanella tropica]|uniref:hypothetical protein n=1 Tax=Parashewanella tropica TaxID=2547970 RepID=UPI0014794830|nr:hypothetical protein [Parashewanella tropica]